MEVPAGEFLYGEDKERRHTDGFRIARYPITNAQYQAFIAAGGYKEKSWWQGLGPPPKTPEDPRWSQPNRPRKSVTWFEAMAFCAWLTERLVNPLGRPIRLPTEFEWERAARGVDGREYPWGDGYRVGYANIDEREDKTGATYLKQTSAVGLYPQGASPEGVLDLAGNVWEWCMNGFQHPERRQPAGTGPRVMRGGSCILDRRVALEAFRDDLVPGLCFFLGFRVLCGPHQAAGVAHPPAHRGTRPAQAICNKPAPLASTPRPPRRRVYWT